MHAATCCGTLQYIWTAWGSAMNVSVLYQGHFNL